VVGYNQFRQDKPSVALGLALIGADNPTGGGVAEGYFPISPSAQVGIQAFAGSGRVNGQAGVAAQIRFKVK
jgi:hypothetical protein